ncbi:DUF7287 family protein [Halorubrum gandharaense]
MRRDAPSGDDHAASATAPTDRGQTVLDFVVGMSVFLLAVGFTFAFVPSLLEPFTAGEGAKMVVAERSAAHLAETSLAAGSTPAVLSTECTRDFFDEVPNDDCNWEHSAADLSAELGVVDHHGLNVTVANSSGSHSIDSVPLVAGDEPPPGASVSTGSRMVDLDGETYRLTVRVW